MICGSHVIGGGHVMGVDVMEVNGGHVMGSRDWGWGVHVNWGSHVIGGGHVIGEGNVMEGNGIT